MQIAHRRHGHNVHALPVQLRRIKLDFVGDDDDRRALAASRVQTQRAHTARHHEPDVAVADFIFPAGPDDRVHDFRVRHRDFEQDGFCGTEQPVNVLLELEHAAVVGADAFEDPVAVKQAVVEDRNLRVAFVMVFAVNENFHA